VLFAPKLTVAYDQPHDVGSGFIGNEAREGRPAYGERRQNRAREYIPRSVGPQFREHECLPRDVDVQFRRRECLPRNIGLQFRKHEAINRDIDGNLVRLAVELAVRNNEFNYMLAAYVWNETR